MHLSCRDLRGNLPIYSPLLFAEGPKAQLEVFHSNHLVKHVPGLRSLTQQRVSDWNNNEKMTKILEQQMNNH